MPSTAAVKSAVFPVAGLGTRFLPATKSIAKELLPILDKPLIQYAMDECVQAGIEQIVLVTSRIKNSLVDHFERDEHLERILREAGKQEQLQELERILPERMAVINVRQSQLLGLGHAVLCARAVVGDAPFAVVLPDDLLVPTGGGPSQSLQDMIALYGECGHSVVAVEEVAADQVGNYGIVDPGGHLGERSFQARRLVEKPSPAQAPSRWGVVGRYVLSPQIFDHLSTERPDAGGEIQLTNAIHSLCPQVAAWQIECARYDCGSKHGFLKANLAAAAEDPDLLPDLREFAAALLARDGKKRGVSGR